LSLDSLTHATAIEAILEAQRTVNAVHEDVVERQKQLDVKIDALMKASEPQASVYFDADDEPPYPSTSKGKGTDPHNWGETLTFLRRKWTLKLRGPY
jgi:hypothetical protein